jgi:mono/diheme cytochrome c family protein
MAKKNTLWAFIVLLTLFGAVARTALAQSATNKKAVNTATVGKGRVSLVDTGRIVFNQRCEICHFADSSARKIGPGLKGLFVRARLTDGTKITESSVADVISEGGQDMPGYQDLLKPGQLQALIAYLKFH